jgi:hypothetical protein
MRELRSKMFTGLHVQCTYSYYTVLRLEFFSTDFLKNIQILRKFFSGGQVVPCGRAGGRTDRQTDMMTLIFAFHNCANTPKKYS